MAAPANDTLTRKVYMAFGSTQGSEKVVVDSSETATGNRWLLIPLELAASASDVQLNLATYVDTATFISVQEKSTGTTGFDVGIAAANKLSVAAGSGIDYKNRTATPPTLYFDNPDASNKVFLEIAVLGAAS